VRRVGIVQQRRAVQRRRINRQPESEQQKNVEKWLVARIGLPRCDPCGDGRNRWLFKRAHAVRFIDLVLEFLKRP